MSKAMVLSVVRHALTMAAGALVANGYLDSSGADQATGAILALVGVVWGALDKRS